MVSAKDGSASLGRFVSLLQEIQGSPTHPPPLPLCIFTHKLHRKTRREDWTLNEALSVTWSTKLKIREQRLTKHKRGNDTSQRPGETQDRRMRGV